MYTIDFYFSLKLQVDLSSTKIIYAITKHVTLLAYSNSCEFPASNAFQGRKLHAHKFSKQQEPCQICHVSDEKMLQQETAQLHLYLQFASANYAEESEQKYFLTRSLRTVQATLMFLAVQKGRENEYAMISLHQMHNSKLFL